jgi:hypothetical protein
MRKYYPKYTDAKRALREAKKEGLVKDYDDINIYDMGKNRKVKRYYIGSYMEWLNYAN